jgi:hypothetical protein
LSPDHVADGSVGSEGPTASGFELATEALETLERRLVLQEEVHAQSHVVLRAEGLDCPESADALGTYLTAALAGAVQVDIHLADRFLGVSVDRRAVLRQRVERVVRASNHLTQDSDRHWRDTRRNPWIAEGIGHLLLFMAGRAATGCLEGRVAALKALHAQASQQGLDLVAIYELGDLPVLAIGETKATHADPSGQLTEATRFFRDIEAHERDGDLVADVTMLETALSDQLRREIGEAFWEKQYTYLPLIVHGTEFDPHVERQLLAGLTVERNHKRLVVVELPVFYEFFNEVADAMRAAVESW